MISTATAMVVTRTVSDGSLNDDVVRQFLDYEAHVLGVLPAEDDNAADELAAAVLIHHGDEAVAELHFPGGFCRRTRKWRKFTAIPSSTPCR